MKAAEKEVEQLEKVAREAAGIVCDPNQDVKTLPPIEIPPFRVLQKQRFEDQRSKADKERRELEDKVSQIEAQIQAAQERLKALNDDSHFSHDNTTPIVKAVSRSKSESSEPASSSHPSKGIEKANDNGDDGSIGPSGEFVVFPLYDGIAQPVEWKKAFTQYCNRTKKDLKDSLPVEQRKNKVSVIDDLRFFGSGPTRFLIFLFWYITLAQGSRFIERRLVEITR
jgi:hypothetical protein